MNDLATMNDASDQPAAHRTVHPSRRLRVIALGLTLSLVLGTTVQSCENAYLAFFCQLYTGIYGEFGCLIDCDHLDFFEYQDEPGRVFWGEVFCEENGIPLASTGQKRQGLRTAAVEPAFFLSVNRDRVLTFTTGNAATQEIVDFGRFPAGLVLDPAAGTMYWHDGRTETLRRANLDGTDEEVLATGLLGLTGLALDAAAGHLYWGNTVDGTIQRFDLTTQAVDDLVTGLTVPFDLALDAAAGHLYWVHVDANGAGAIQRLDLSTQAVDDVVTGLTAPYGLALDLAGGAVYWSDMMDGAIRRAGLDGTGIEDVLTGLDAPGALALDAGTLYWAEMGASLRIQRAGLDGTNVETVANGTVADLALDPAADRLYWTGWINGTVRRANLDGSGGQVLFTGGSISGDLALDVARQKLYWAVTTSGVIQRANLDGTGVEDILDLQFGPDALAFDPVGDKLYWTASGDIRRADPDGANAETIVTGIVFIGDLEIDPAGGKIYWVNRESIQRANLDGTGIETFYTDTDLVGHLALHDGILYWSVPFPDVIRRVALDGSTGVEDVVTGVNFVQQIDITGDKLYWSLPLESKIQRSNLDGTGVEDVLGNVVEVTGLITEDATVVPVELTRFDATVDGRDVLLRWETASETNNAGFEIQRRSKPGEAGWESLGFVEGSGTTLEAQRYEYRVEGVPPGRYTFRLKQVDFDGTFAYGPETEVSVELATAFQLSPAYPNPFNPQTRFTLSVRETQHVAVTVYDALGREVARLHDGMLAAHQPHTFTIHAEGWASGLYLCEVAGEHFRTTQTIILSK